MPQFDQFSFFNQITWFLFFFFTFYFLITYFFLPKISYYLKFQKKKIKMNQQKKINFFFERNNLSLLFYFLNKNFYLNFKIFINQNKNSYLKNKVIKKKTFLQTIIKIKMNHLLFLKSLFIKNFL